MQDVAKKGFDWGETKAAFRTLLTRNSILVILLPVANQIVVNIKNSWRSIYVMNDCGQSATVLGVLMSFLLIVALLSRTPIGVLTDKFRNQIKPFIGTILLVKAFIPLLLVASKSTAWLWFVFFVDSVTWSAVQIITGAMMAVVINRKALGTGFAIRMALVSWIANPARGWGMNIFNSFGANKTAWITVVLGLLLLIPVILLDKDKLNQSYSASSDKKREETPQLQEKSRFQKFIDSLCLTALPLACLSAISYFYMQMMTNYMPVYATDNHFNYTMGVTIGGGIAGFMFIIVGIIADLVNPFLLAGLSLTMLTISPLAMGISATNAAFIFGIAIYYAFETTHTIPLKVILIKRHTPAQQGAVSGTIMFANDIFSIAAATVCGILIDSVGYHGTFFAFAVINGAAAVICFVLAIRYAHQKKQQSKVVEKTA